MLWRPRCVDWLIMWRTIIKLIKNTIGKIVGALCFIALAGYIVSATEKPWEIDRTKLAKVPLEHQVGICMLKNLGTAQENIAELMRIAGLRFDGETALDLIISGTPSLGRRYDCFARLSEGEIETVRSKSEYHEIVKFVELQSHKFNRHFTGQ